MFVQGQIYSRRTLHQQVGGQEQGGISTPSKLNVILLFTGKSGEQYGYLDQWSDEGVFFYTGEGQVGDMEFVRGNRAIRDHSLNGKDIHLFSQTTQKGFVRYEAQMICTGFHYVNRPRKDGKARRAIVFELSPISAFGQAAIPAPSAIEDEPPHDLLEKASLEELRKKALSASGNPKSVRERKAMIQQRSRAIKLYVLKRANGKCEGCGTPAPFRTPKRKLYLEPHHIRRLSDGGPDHPRWVVAVCPNCHRRAHYSEDARTYNEHLTKIVGRREGE